MSLTSRSLSIVLCFAGSLALAAQEPKSAALWDSPQRIQPIDLKWSPSGAQLFIHLRPAAIDRADAARRSLQAVEPRFGAIIAHWLQLAEVEAPHVESMIWAIGRDDSSAIQTVAITRLASEQPALSPIAPMKIDSNDLGRWVAEDRVVVVGPMKTLLEIQKSNGQQSYLNRPMSQILRKSSQSSHFTLLGSPSFLLRDVPDWFRGDAGILLEPLENVLTEQTQAASISVRVTDKEAFGEVRMQMTLERRRSLRKRLSEIVTTALRFANDRWKQKQPPDSYWQRLSDRWPSMLDYVESHIRSGWDGEQAVFNVSLPPSAAHNLLLAGDLLLAADAPTTNVDDHRLSLRELLSDRFEYEFKQRSFDDAFLGLARELNAVQPDVEFRIVIDGPNLQRAGVTRNQELGTFAVGPKPIGQVLTLLTMRANPSPVTRPSDPMQEIVWSVVPDPDDRKTQVVLITSRQAATKNRLVLPKYYRQK